MTDRTGSFDYSILDTKELTQEEKERRECMIPKEYRGMVRKGRWKPDGTLTQYYCQGYTQHSVTILPKEYALEFLVFCIRNPRACYAADVCDVGSPHPPVLAPDADVRTDCHRYRVFKNGVVVDEPYDVMKYWADDMVAFLLNCSMGFEGVLRQKHVNFTFQGTHVSNIKCMSSGRFKSDGTIVSTRIFPTSLDAVRAVQITSQLPVSHGYPLDIGDGTKIGIDLRKPLAHMSFPNDPPLPKAGEVCMSWACAVTPEKAIEAAKPPLAITHYPGMVFISDRRTEEFHSSFTR